MEQTGQDSRNRDRGWRWLRRPDGVPAWVYGVAGVFPIFVLGYLALAPLLDNDADNLTTESNVNGPCVPLVQPCPDGSSTQPASGPTGSPTPTPTQTPTSAATDTPSPSPTRSQAPRLHRVFISDLAFQADNGWGPVERDRSNGERDRGDGGTLTIGGQTFAKGLGVHAPSLVRVPLRGRCVQFHAEIGIDDEKDRGRVVFQVVTDGRAAFTSDPLDAGDHAFSVDIGVAGVRNLDLEVLTDGTRKNDHADWGDASLLCA